MGKAKTLYTCQECAGQFPKWTGQCGNCNAWNTLVEDIPTAKKSQSYAGDQHATITSITDVILKNEDRISTGFSEFDRVLGGGLVVGSVVLIGGDPGIGKSTILLQSLCHVSKDTKVLYVTGEESIQQVTMRARRLGLPEPNLRLLTDTNVDHILQLAAQEKPDVMVIDSIQTMCVEGVSSAAGSVSQVRESAAQITAFAKQTGTSLFLVGHVTKEGALAGPRVLEHIVDTVLYFEGESDSRYRVIRAVKNRFGAVNELAIFAMTDVGLKEVSNPSAIFLSRFTDSVPGSTIMSTWEGSRPLLLEIQALVDESYLANPRRVCVGLEQNRLSMLLAVLHRHGNIATYNQDVFVNVVGGVKVSETAADLPLLASVISSLKNQPLPKDLVIFGEVGLSGEIRPVQSGEARLHEAEKHGFKHAIIPAANAPRKSKHKINLMPVNTLPKSLEQLDQFLASAIV